VAFAPGQSGNPGGRSKEKIWRNAIERAVKRATEGKTDYTAIDELADALVTAGKAGDVPALREIGDRLDGKSVQAIANDDDGSPFIVKVLKGKVDVTDA
jgi:hypothetical protein